jgi:hypothetical protein
VVLCIPNGKEKEMRIEAGVNSLYGSQRSQAAVDRSANSTSFSAVLSASQAGASQASSTKQVDFTSMSRQELRDWTNSQIRSGEMSLDDSRPFMAMSMKIPVSGGLGGELSAGSDDTQYNFTQKVRDGIQGALSRGDETTLKMLESAMQIMQKRQGQTIGVDVRA